MKKIVVAGLLVAGLGIGSYFLTTKTSQFTPPPATNPPITPPTTPTPSRFIDQQYMISGHLTKGASDQDIEVLKRAVSEQTVSFGLLERFPPGFQIITKDQKSCEKVRTILSGYKFVDQFGKCELQVAPTNPNRPVSSK